MILHFKQTWFLKIRLYFHLGQISKILRFIKMLGSKLHCFWATLFNLKDMMLWPSTWSGPCEILPLAHGGQVLLLVILQFLYGQEPFHLHQWSLPWLLCPPLQGLWHGLQLLWSIPWQYLTRSSHFTHQVGPGILQNSFLPQRHLDLEHHPAQWSSPLHFHQ